MMLEGIPLASKADQLFEMRRKKWELEDAHLRYLYKQGLTNLEIADRLTSMMIQMLREGIISRHPNASEICILQEMRLIAESEKKMKQRRIRVDG